MAIDSKEKRASITALLNIHPGILPSATIDEEQRQAIAYSYSGNAGNLIPPVAIAVAVDGRRLVSLWQSARQSLTVGTDAYTAGDALGVKQGIKVGSERGFIRSISITDSEDTASSTYNVWFFESEPTGIAANAAFALADVDLEKVIAVHFIDSEFDAINGKAHFETTQIPYSTLDGVQWIQVELVASTPTFTSTDAVKIKLFIEFG